MPQAKFRTTFFLENFFFGPNDYWFFDPKLLALASFPFKSIFYDSTDINVINPKKGVAKISGVANYTFLSYKLYELNGIYEFAIPINTWTRIQMREKLSLDEVEGFFGNEKEFIGSAITLFPHKIHSVNANGYFFNDAFYGNLNFNLNETWFFRGGDENHPNVFYTNKELDFNPILPKVALKPQEWPGIGTIVDKDSIEDGSPGKYCVIEIIIDEQLWRKSQIEFGDNAEYFLQDMLDEVESQLSKYYSKFSFGGFGKGPKFMFSTPTILKERKPEYDLMYQFNYMDSYKAFTTFNWGGRDNCLSAHLTYRKNQDHGIGYLGVVCATPGLDDNGLLIHQNAFSINFYGKYDLETDSFYFKTIPHLFHDFAHEIGHNFNATHDPMGSIFLMREGLNVDSAVDPNPPLSKDSHGNITKFLEMLVEIGKDDMRFGYTNCFVSRDRACKKTGRCKV